MAAGKSMNPAARAQRRADGKQAARAQPKQHGAPCRDFDSRPPVHACTIVRGAANGHELRATRLPTATGCRGNWRRGELVHGHGATPPVSATARRVFGGLGRAKRCCPCSRGARKSNVVLPWGASIAFRCDSSRSGGRVDCQERNDARALWLSESHLCDDGNPGAAVR